MRDARRVEQAHRLTQTIGPEIGRMVVGDRNQIEPHRLHVGGERAFAPELAEAVAGAVEGRQIEEHAFRSEEHTSELQSIMRISYAVFCLKKKRNNTHHNYTYTTS